MVFMFCVFPDGPGARAKRAFYRLAGMAACAGGELAASPCQQPVLPDCAQHLAEFIELYKEAPAAVTRMWNHMRDWLSISHRIQARPQSRNYDASIMLPRRIGLVGYRTDCIRVVFFVAF
jgi:hypothetical protein